MMHRNGRVALAGWGLLLVTLLIPACEILDPNPGPDPYNERDGRFDPVRAPIIPIDTVPPSLERGTNLFEQFCARCHGDDGSDGGEIFPGSIQGKKGIRLTIREGRGAMPAFATMTDNEIASIQQFLNDLAPDLSSATDEELYVFYCGGCHGDSASGTSRFEGSIRGRAPVFPILQDGFGKMPAIDIDAEKAGAIQRHLLSLAEDLSALDGRGYYRRVCASCHGSEGEGNWRGPEIRNPVEAYATWVTRNGRKTQPRFPHDMPEYTTDSLSDRQLGEIIDWLRSAEKPTSGKGLYNRFCSTCHAVDGTGGPSDQDISGELRDRFFDKIRNGEGERQYSQQDEYMPAWSRAELTDKEIRQIAHWIRH